jgi:hypothetical protein
LGVIRIGGHACTKLQSTPGESRPTPHHLLPPPGGSDAGTCSWYAPGIATAGSHHDHKQARHDGQPAARAHTRPLRMHAIHAQVAPLTSQRHRLIPRHGHGGAVQGQRGDHVTHLGGEAAGQDPGARSAHDALSCHRAHCLTQPSELQRVAMPAFPSEAGTSARRPGAGNHSAPAGAGWLLWRGPGAQCPPLTTQAASAGTGPGRS